MRLDVLGRLLKFLANIHNGFNSTVLERLHDCRFRHLFEFFSFTMQGLVRFFLNEHRLARVSPWIIAVGLLYFDVTI